MMSMVIVSLYREGSLAHTVSGQWQETADGWTMVLPPETTVGLPPGIYDAHIPHPVNHGEFVGRAVEVRADIRPDLLRRYMAHVRACEGVTFVDDDRRTDSAAEGVTFTDDEWAHLLALDAAVPGE